MKKNDSTSTRPKNTCAYMACGLACSSQGCWRKCRRPDGHSGDHQCDEHGGSA